MVPFECDLCIYRKLTGHSPWENNTVANLLLGCIRRINLDVFWSSSSATVNGNRDKLVLGFRLSRLVGLEGPCILEGPLPAFDHCGYDVAIQMLLYSKRPGKHCKTHLQLETIRKLRASFSNQVRCPWGTSRERTNDSRTTLVVRFGFTGSSAASRVGWDRSGNQIKV